MSIPEYMPILSHGEHSDPKEGACVMEYVSILAGEPFSDSPSCTHPALVTVAIAANDELPDEDRQELIPFIPRLIGTATSDPIVNVKLAVAAVEHVRELQHWVVRGNEDGIHIALSMAHDWLSGGKQYKTWKFGDSLSMLDDLISLFSDADEELTVSMQNMCRKVVHRANLYTLNDIAMLEHLLDTYESITGVSPVPLTHAQYAQLASATR